MFWTDTGIIVFTLAIGYVGFQLGKKFGHLFNRHG